MSTNSVAEYKLSTAESIALQILRHSPIAQSEIPEYFKEPVQQAFDSLCQKGLAIKKRVNYPYAHTMYQINENQRRA